jgi:hypothetical protein
MPNIGFSLGCVIASAWRRASGAASATHPARNKLASWQIGTSVGSRRGNLHMFRVTYTLGVAARIAVAPSVLAQSKISDDVVKLGVMTDLSGPYVDDGGSGSVLAVQMAIDDFGHTVLGKPVELITEDGPGGDG